MTKEEVLAEYSEHEKAVTALEESHEQELEPRDVRMKRWFAEEAAQARTRLALWDRVPLSPVKNHSN